MKEITSIEKYISTIMKMKKDKGREKYVARSEESKFFKNFYPTKMANGIAKKLRVSSNGNTCISAWNKH